MANAKRDDNRIPTMLGTSNVDGVTPVSLVVNSMTHALKISDGSTGSGFPYENAERDENRVTTLMGVSSADGVTPIPIYCDSTGNLLTKST